MDHFIALGMLSIIAVTVWAMRKYGQFRVTLLSALYSIVSFIGILHVLQILTFHMCKTGSPLTETIATALCFSLVIASMHEEHDKKRRKLVIQISRLTRLYILVVGATVSFGFVAVVHQPDFTGNPLHIIRHMEAVQKSKLEYLSGVIAEHPSLLKASYPAGWFKDSGLLASLPKKERESSDTILTSHSFRAYPRWHTWLTGIYGKETTPLELWYPGGMVEEALPRLSYRKRAEER